MSDKKRSKAKQQNQTSLKGNEFYARVQGNIIFIPSI